MGGEGVWEWGEMVRVGMEEHVNNITIEDLFDVLKVICSDLESLFFTL